MKIEESKINGEKLLSMVSCGDLVKIDEELFLVAADRQLVNLADGDICPYELFYDWEGFTIETKNYKIVREEEE